MDQERNGRFLMHVAIGGWASLGRTEPDAGPMQEPAEGWPRGGANGGSASGEIRVS